MRPCLLLLLPLLIAACASTQQAGHAPAFAPQPASALVDGRVVAVAYSPYRKGQHPDRGQGAIEPSDAEVVEDLKLLARDDNFSLIRLYDSGPGSARILELIRANDLPIRVMLGAWLNAEISTHETCDWVTEPVPQEKLDANAAGNAAELERAIVLAKRFPNLIVAVNVGNEVLVDWNDHRVSVKKLVGYIEEVKAAIEQPVTVADNYVPWTKYPAVGKAVDFAAVHTYPVWEGKSIDDGLSYTLENLQAVQAANPGLPIAIGEAGWTSVASEFGARASQAHQTRYFRELMAFGRDHNVTVFFFEAFDESWKGNPNDPMGAEKHWGLFDEARRPKAVIHELYPELPLSDR